MEDLEAAATRKDEQSKARRWRYIPLLGALAVVAVNVVIYRNPFVYGLVPLVAAALALAVVIPLNRRNRQLVASLASREQLSEHISQLPTRMKRLNWVWLEYAMARNIVRGTYDGEAPADFAADVGYLSRRLIRRTRFNARWVVGGGVVLVLFCVGMALPLVLLDVSSIWFALGFVIVPLVFSVIYYYVTVGSSDDPRRSIARRVEHAADVVGPERWDELLRVAHDEQAVNLDA